MECKFKGCISKTWRHLKAAQLIQSKNVLQLSNYVKSVVGHDQDSTTRDYGNHDLFDDTEHKQLAAKIKALGTNLIKVNILKFRRVVLQFLQLQRCLHYASNMMIARADQRILVGLSEKKDRCSLTSDFPACNYFLRLNSPLNYSLQAISDRSHSLCREDLSLQLLFLVHPAA